MDKKQQLINILQSHFQYPEDEINHIINHIQPVWFTFEQSDDEIIRQVGCEYALWRGLGTAILNYLQWEEKSC